MGKLKAIKSDDERLVTRREVHQILARFAKLADAAMERKIAGLLHELRTQPIEPAPHTGGIST